MIYYGMHQFHAFAEERILLRRVFVVSIRGLGCFSLFSKKKRCHTSVDGENKRSLDFFCRGKKQQQPSVGRYIHVCNFDTPRTPPIRLCFGAGHSTYYMLSGSISPSLEPGKRWKQFIDRYQILYHHTVTTVIFFLPSRLTLCYRLFFKGYDDGLEKPFNSTLPSSSSASSKQSGL
jgi:hypothetical protein